MTPSPLEVLVLRAQVRRILWDCHEWDTLEQAITPLLEFADQSGATDLIGPAGVAAMINSYFGSQADGGAVTVRGKDRDMASDHGGDPNTGGQV